jgi:hypothetical protein
LRDGGLSKRRGPNSQGADLSALIAPFEGENWNEESRFMEEKIAEAAVLVDLVLGWDGERRLISFEAAAWSSLYWILRTFGTNSKPIRTYSDANATGLWLVATGQDKGKLAEGDGSLGENRALFSDEQAFGLPFLDQANSQRKHNEGSSDGLTNSTTDWHTSRGIHLKAGFMLTGTIREHRWFSIFSHLQRRSKNGLGETHR